MAHFFRNEPEKLVEAILIADEVEEFLPLVGALKPQSAVVQKQLRNELSTHMPSKLDKSNDQLSNEEESIRDARWKRQALAAVTMVHLGFEEDVWPLLKLTDNPSLRSLVIHYLGELGTNPNILATRLNLEEEASTRRALIQSLGGLDISQIQDSDRKRIVEQLKAIYANDLDSGVHSSAIWTLRKWQETVPDLVTEELRLSEEHEQQLIGLASEIAKAKSAIEEENLNRIAKWAEGVSRVYKDLPSLSEESLLSHYRFDDYLDSNETTPEARQSIELHGDPKPKITNGVLGHAVELRGGSFVTGDTLRINTQRPFGISGWYLFRERGKGAGLLSHRDKANRLNA